MTAPERSLLLLTSHLGDPGRKVLTAAQLRKLARGMRLAGQPEASRDLREEDLLAAGCTPEQARQILSLLSQEDQLEAYLRRGRDQGCVPITRASTRYPRQLRERLGPDCPGCLWARGDLNLMEIPSVSLVGSRALREENRRFARAVGYEAALQNLTLVSGNARGADSAAQEACLEAEGCVISIVADALTDHPGSGRHLYLSEGDFDSPFSRLRALSRNRCIHAWSPRVFVAQSDVRKGGTWDGTVKNLRARWSEVSVFRDGSPAALELERLGARPVTTAQLGQLHAAAEGAVQLSLF